MKRYRPVLMMLASILMAAASFAQESLPEVFNRMKAEFGQGQYQKSLGDVELLDSLSRKAGFEKDRAALSGPIVFYRAASLAGLGKRDEAREEFINFIVATPNASISAASFPKPVVDAFEQAHKIAAGRSNSIQTAYASFVPRQGWFLPADSEWPKSPVRYLLSNEQKKTYAGLMSEEARKAFVEEFWRAFDPTPETPQNEFRTEFERRIAFAQMNFTDEALPGIESDRAVILAFLGPPTYAGQSAMSANDDAMAMLRGGGQPTMAPKGKGNQARGFGDLTGNSGASSIETPDKRGTRESWYYRGARIPSHVPFKEVRVDFVTKEGYGDGVMQKESQVLQALGIATDNARKDKKLN